MKARRAGVVLELWAICMPVALAMTCVSDPRLDEQDAVESRRAALVTCTSSSQCVSGRVCCAGHCALPAGGKLASLGSNNALEYGCYAAQSGTHFPNPPANNILPDFSFAGYGRGGVAIPNAPVAVTLAPRGNGLDDSAAIQAALDSVGAMSPPTPRAVALTAGVFNIDTGLNILKSNVVLRGKGQGPGGTVLMSRIAQAHVLVEIEPAAPPSYPLELPGTQRTITTTSVAVGSKVFSIQGSGFAVGDDVVVVRTPNANWTADIHTDVLDEPWQPSELAVPHPRKIVAVSSSGGNQTLTVDIPIVDSLEKNAYGGGYVAKVGPGGWVERSGVEDLRIDAQFEDTSIEDNDWSAVRLTRAMNSWVRRVTVKRFGMAAVHMTGWSSFNTVEEVAHLNPKSPLHPPPPADTGLPYSSHRYSFWVSSGIGNLFQRCFTRDSRHSFVTGREVTGPNVWLDNLSVKTNAEEGPHLYWATGLLFDNIHTEASALSQLGEAPNGGVRVQNAGNGGTSHGWTGAQVMIWNCQAPLVADAPAGGMNWVVGGIGFPYEGRGNEEYGIWQTTTTTVKPRSLYHQQLKDRLGTTAFNAVTTTQQRSGRIWEALRNWAGEGKLDDSYPDPTCARGKQNGRTCCASKCLQCGGSQCSFPSNGGTADECCVTDIVENDRSCAHYPPPCVMPSPSCEGGILNGNICCSSLCNQCGGQGCGTPSVNPQGSADLCCSTDIVENSRSCLEYPPPCVMADPMCVNGVQGNTTCCHASCTQCGGTGCSSGTNTSANCCGGTISGNGRQCGETMAPCNDVPAISEL